MPSTCVFKFDRPNPIYYDGETINASLRLQTESEKTCRQVYIRFIGEAKVSWHENRNRGCSKRTETFTAHETYLENRAVVHGEGKLPPGTYDYTFRIALPTHIPSSCVGEYGQIKYQLMLVIDRPMRFDNEFRQPITVVQNVNLNLSPEYLLPLHDEDIKYVCCWPCKSGPIVSTLTIPHGGYVPGQNVNYTLHVDNRSQGYNMNGIQLRFVQTFEFTATSPEHHTRFHSVTLSESKQNETVMRMSKRKFEGMLLVPSVPPTTREQRAIRVHYKIVFFVKTGCCHKDAEISIPITIGTVPLVQTA